jgi:hypothetical protein
MTDVSDEPTASIIIVEAVSASKTSVSVYQTKDATSKKTAIFIIVAVRTLHLTRFQIKVIDFDYSISYDNFIQYAVLKKIRNFNFSFTLSKGL